MRFFKFPIIGKILEEANYLDYNVAMKKILTKTVFISSLCLLMPNMAFSTGVNFKEIKNVIHKTPAQALKASKDDSLTPSEQATIFYNENNIKNSFDTLLMIKDADRTAQDWLLLGNILQDQGKMSDAIFMYQRAITLDSKFYKAYYNLGNMYLEDDKPYLAIENYRKANKSNSEFPYAYYNLGCAYLKIGNLKKARIAFLKAIEIKNTEADFHYNLAYTYKMMNKPKFGKQYLDNYNKLMSSKE